MIIYDLACPHGHRFEGWFGSGDDFAAQKARELVRCPICDDAGVAIVPSAKVATPRAGAGAGGGRPATPDRAAARPGAPAAGGTASALRTRPATATRPTRTPATRCPRTSPRAFPPKCCRSCARSSAAAEDVGRRFPEEARRIHYDEAPARPIRGQASREETEELREEGIDVSPLPPFLTGDEH